jgi:hypothetical protein
VIANVTSLVVMTAVALIVGWRVLTSPQEALLGFLLLLFAYALSWVMVVASLLWTALILAVFVPLGTWRYRKAVSR